MKNVDHSINMVNPAIIVALIIFALLVVAGIGGAIYYVNKDKCEKASDCEANEICVIEADETSGKCQPKCTKEDDCALAQTCNKDTGKCIAKASLKANGTECATNSECQNGNCKALVCTAKSADGDECSANSNCVSGTCTGGVCIASSSGLKANGADCTAPTQCQSSTCTGGICVASSSGGLKANGADCTAGTQCQSSTCTGGICVASSSGGLKANGADCTAGTQCQSSTCTGGICVASPSGGGNTVGLAEGDTVKCNSPYATGGSAAHTYRYTGDQLRWYPTQPIATSWGATNATGTFLNIKQVDCATLTVGDPMEAKPSTGGGSGTKVKGDPCSANSECASGNCGPSTLTGFFKSFFKIGASVNVCLDPVAGNSLGLVEGDAVVCTEPYPSGGGPYHVYRYTNGQLRHYPSEAIALSWDPTFATVRKTVNCATLTVGAPMELKPGSTSTFTLNNERLKNEANSKCLAVAGMGILDGEKLTTLNCDTIGNHKNFTWQPTTELRNHHSSKYVTVGPTASQLTQYSLRASPNTTQKWIYDAATKQFRNTVAGTTYPGQPDTVLCMELIDDVIPKVSGMPCDSTKSSQRWTKV